MEEEKIRSNSASSYEKAMQYAYRDQQRFRVIMDQGINAGVRAEGLTYSKFINGLAKLK